MNSKNLYPLMYSLINLCYLKVQQNRYIYVIVGSADTRPNSRRIRFTPPLEMFTVCHYTAPTLKQLPVAGRYEMKVSFIPIVLFKYIDYQVLPTN